MPEIAYTVTYLEMTSAPTTAPPPPPWRPSGAAHALLRVAEPPTHFFLYLYQTVGAEYHWTDLLAWDRADLDAFVGDEKVELNVLYRAGAPIGFYQLDFREAGVCDLAYFGMMPEAVGMGLGSWLLRTALQDAWAATRGDTIERMTVNTCTLDHPSALQTYQRAGFQPVRRIERTRVIAD